MGDGDNLKSKLILEISGAVDQEVAEFLDLLFYECLNGNSAARREAFSRAMRMAQERPDLRPEDDAVTAGSWGVKDEGWVYIYRNEDGYSLWYHPELDGAILQKNFFE